MPVRFAFWMSCAFSIGILDYYLEVVFWHCVLCFSHMSVISMRSLSYHQRCTLGEITRRIKEVIPIMRVIFYYLNSKSVVFFLCKCLITLKRVFQKGETLVSLYWATIHIVNEHMTKVILRSMLVVSLSYSIKPLKTRKALVTPAPIHVIRWC